MNNFLKIIEFPKEKKTKIIAAVFQKLKKKKKVKFFLEKNENDLPNEPGAYIVWKGNKPIYVGQSRSLKERYSDLRRTYNHALRKHIGKKEFEGKIIKNKFSKKTEDKLNKYFKNRLTLSYIEINFGRSEVEDGLVDFLKKKYELYNEEIKRGKRNIK